MHTKKLFGNENKVIDHIRRKLSQMKNKILPTCLQGNFGDSLGEFSNASSLRLNYVRPNRRYLGTFQFIKQKYLNHSDIVPWVPWAIKIHKYFENFFR